MAPCGCWFHPCLFHIEWASTHLPPVPINILPGSDVPPSPSDAPCNNHLGDLADKLAVSDEELRREALSLLGCSPNMVGGSQDGPGSVPMPGDPGGTSTEGSPLASAPPLSPTPSLINQFIEGLPDDIDTSGTGTPAGTPPGTNTLLGSDGPPSPSLAHHNQHLGDLALPERVPLEEALRVFDCSLDTEGLIQDGPDSSPMPGDPADTGAAVPPCPFASLALPEELLTPDYGVPEIADAILGLEEFAKGLQPHEPWGDAAMDLPPSQPATAQQRGRKRGSSPSTEPPSQRRALAGSRGGAGGD